MVAELIRIQQVLIKMFAEMEELGSRTKSLESASRSDEKQGSDDKTAGHDSGHSGEGHETTEHDSAEHAGSLKDHYLGQDHLLSHVQDDREYLFKIPGGISEESFIPVKLPRLSPYDDARPLVPAPKGLEEYIGPITFQPSKFIYIELIAAMVVAALFIWLGKKVKAGGPPRGRLWNMLEAGVVYIRDEVARPAIGEREANRFLPFLWTAFFFILTMNLLGMFPLFGTPTGSLSVTAALALGTFAVVLFSGMKKLGVAGFWKAQAPHVELPSKLMGFVLIPMIWAIEVFGLFIKHMVLAVRLFANMFAGHLVLAVFVGFIGVTWGSLLSAGVIPAAVGASVAIGLLELLVAFIQAYVFTFLSALFIGAAIHPH